MYEDDVDENQKQPTLFRFSAIRHPISLDMQIADIFIYVYDKQSVGNKTM